MDKRINGLDKVDMTDKQLRDAVVFLPEHQQRVLDKLASTPTATILLSTKNAACSKK